MSTLKSLSYEQMLFNLLPHLAEYKSYSGGEGAAYFIDENFVVKEYTKNFRDRDELFLDEFFEKYCEEIQYFANNGFSVPKIYAWLKVPNLNKVKIENGSEMKHKYYILEENIQGRWIYYFDADLDEMYNVCKNICSQESFKKALMDGERAVSLRKEILRAYISDYLNMNERLISMSDNELERFVSSAYSMAVGGIYSEPDLFRKNILVNDSDIMLVDNRFRNCNRFNYNGEIDEHFLATLIDLIEYNKFIDDNVLLNSCDKSLYDESIGKLIAKNRKVCLALTHKIMNILNKKLEISPVRNKDIYEDIQLMVTETFKEDAEKVMPMIKSEVERSL